MSNVIIHRNLVRRYASNNHWKLKQPFEIWAYGWIFELFGMHRQMGWKKRNEVCAKHLCEQGADYDDGSSRASQYQITTTSPLLTWAVPYLRLATHSYNNLIRITGPDFAFSSISKLVDEYQTANMTPSKKEVCFTQTELHRWINTAHLQE